MEKKLEETSLGEHKQNTEKLYSGLVWDSKVSSILSNFIIIPCGRNEEEEKGYNNFRSCLLYNLHWFDFYGVLQHHIHLPWTSRIRSLTFSSHFSQHIGTVSTISCKPKQKADNGWLAIACIIRTWFNTPKFSGHQSPSKNVQAKNMKKHFMYREVKVRALRSKLNSLVASPSSFPLFSLQLSFPPFSPRRAAIWIQQVRLARVAASTSANHAVHNRKTVTEKGSHIESLHAIIIPLQLIPNRLEIESTTTLESDGTPEKKYSSSVQLLYSAISFASYLVVIGHRRLGLSTKERSNKFPRNRWINGI